MMRLARVLDNLRGQEFYRGQILEVREEPGKAPQSVPTTIFAENNERFAGGSLETLLAVLGQESLHKSLAAALSRCFPGPENNGTNEDAILCARISQTRELFWQLAALIEALDEGRFSIILCPDNNSAKATFRALEDLIERADVGYAIDIRLIDDRLEASNLNSRPAHVTVLGATALERILHLPAAANFVEVLFSGLGRVVLPCADDWIPATASHTAILLRELHVACLSRGVDLSLTATAGAGPAIEKFLTQFWGKPLPGDAFVKVDSVEAVPLTWINYTGAMVRDTGDVTRWIRQPIEKATHELLDWLVGNHPAKRIVGDHIELHYVIDVSGSMADGSLEAVQRAIIADFTHRRGSAMLKDEDTLKVTAFGTEATTLLEAVVNEIPETTFTDCINELKASGGTELSSGIGAALKQALQSLSATVTVILFTDGYSPLCREDKQNLLDMTRRIRAEGRDLEIFYVMLDMSPPTEIKNLIKELGGILVEESASSLGSSGRDGAWRDQQSSLKGDYVLFLSGERGMPESILQEHQGGLRKVVFTRNTAMLKINPKDVAAVVVSGWFGGLAQIGNQVRHLGTRNLPVFLLTDAEASAQLIRGNYPESEALAFVPLVFPENPLLSRQRLLSALRAGPIPPAAFKYLMDGQNAYDSFLQAVYNPPSLKDRSKLFQTLQDRFESILGGTAFLKKDPNALTVELAMSDTTAPDDTVLSTFSTERVNYSGAGINGCLDEATWPLVLHTGAIVDDCIRTASVAEITAEDIELGMRDKDRCAPILQNVSLEPNLNEETAFHLERVGLFNAGPLRFQCEVTGILRYPTGNLDGDSRRESFNRPRKTDFETFALQWQPEGSDGDEILCGLANILRLTLGTLIRNVDQTCLVYPDCDHKSIWIIDLAPGGNGAAQTLFQQNDRFQDLLSLAGRLALDCPCEGGFSGCTDSNAKHETKDTGCPRCTRTIGPVILSSGDDKDLFTRSRKHQTLLWLAKSKLLPDSAAKHLDEKYTAGITEALRFHGRDQGSRREIRSLTRQIFRDRLGLEIDDADVANFAFLPASAPDGLLGSYKNADNLLSMRKGLKEWWALDVYGHEFFHNLQFKVEGLLHPSLVQPDIPMDGKLFIEGSAVWAESHFVDAIAIRTALDLANLREGDEYGEGFQIMKWIEENLGGVNAVLRFLANGDIAAVSKGKIANLDELYRQIGFQA